MFDFQRVVLTGVLAVTLGATSALAGEAEFGFTQEFLTVCDGTNSSYKKGKQKFVDNDWSLTGVEMTSALSPAFFLTKIKDYEGFEVTLDNGGTWYGTYSRGELSGTKVHMCNMWLISDSITGVRDDMAQAVDRSSPQLLNVSGERRYVYAEDNDPEIYFAQEGNEEDGVTTIVLAKVYEGR